VGVYSSLTEALLTLTEVLRIRLASVSQEASLLWLAELEALELATLELAALLATLLLLEALEVLELLTALLEALAFCGVLAALEESVDEPPPPHAENSAEDKHRASNFRRGYSFMQHLRRYSDSAGGTACTNHPNPLPVAKPSLTRQLSPSCFSGKIRGFASFNMIRRTESRKFRQMAYPLGISQPARIHRQNRRSWRPPGGSLIGAIALRSIVALRAPYANKLGRPMKDNRLARLKSTRNPDKRLKQAFHPAHDLPGWMGANIAGQFAAMPEDGNRGNAANTKPGCQRAFCVGIDLAENGAPLELPGSFGKHRRHSQTGLAPRCPEVNNNGKVATLDKCIEIGQRQFDWRGRQNGRLADAANRIIVQALVGHAINGLAMMADDFHGVLRIGSIRYFKAAWRC
jgi:hypothetical protein